MQTYYHTNARSFSNKREFLTSSGYKRCQSARYRININRMCLGSRDCEIEFSVETLDTKTKAYEKEEINLSIISNNCNEKSRRLSISIIKNDPERPTSKNITNNKVVMLFDLLAVLEGYRKYVSKEYFSKLQHAIMVEGERLAIRRQK